MKQKDIKGLKKVCISTLNKSNETECFLVLQFDSQDSVKIFAGEDYEQAYVPENARRVYSRYDKTSQHFKLKD